MKPVAVIHHAVQSATGTRRVFIIGAINGEPVLSRAYLLPPAAEPGEAPGADAEDDPTSSRRSLTSLILDMFVELWRAFQDEGMIIYISDAKARVLLGRLVEAGELPGLDLRTVVTGRTLLATWGVCSQILGDLLLPVAGNQPELKSIPRRIIATDASKQSRDNLIGLGIASDAGKVKLRQMTAASIAEGEFAAVTLALCSWERAEVYEILTDSRIVYRRLNHPQWKNPLAGNCETGCVEEVARLRESGIVINVHWVRSHSEHPLNCIADRCAVAARRCGQWGLASARQKIREQIQADLVQALVGVDPESLIPQTKTRDGWRARTILPEESCP